MIRAFQTQTPNIGDNTYIDESALVIGKVTLGSDCSVWPMTVIRGDVNSIHIGKRTNIQDACVLHVTHAGKYNPEGYSLTIGDEVTVGHRVTLHSSKIQD